MADLDDFFAKKDRKRQKARRGADEAPARQEPPRQEPQQQPQQQQQQPPPQQQPQHHTEEDEWREVEVAKKADYTGLKIQHLTPGQETNPNIEGYIAGASNTFGDQKSKGPWNKTASEVVEVVVEKEPPPPSEVILPPPPSSNAYVPPLLRNRPPGYMDGPAIRTKHGKQMAPDINSQEFFPVLGVEGPKKHGAGGAGGGGGGHWSEASRGPPASARPPPREVSTGNRFNSFQNDS